MESRRIHFDKVIVSVVVVLLLSVIVTMEFPEFLAVTDDTTNDFTIRKTITVDSFALSLSGGHRQITHIDFDSLAPKLLSPFLSPVAKVALAPAKLFILHCELRT